MGRHSTTYGQSLVEMALILPILLVVLFGIMEFGWLIFAYSTISQAARNGAEVAAQLPPHVSWLSTSDMDEEELDDAGFGSSYPGFRADRCVDAVLTAIESDITVFGGPDDAQRMTEFVTISYPNGAATRNLADRGPIEVAIAYPVRGLTPAFNLLGLGDGSGTITMRVVQRRSIENLGRDPTSPTYLACASDLASYQEINAP